MSISTDSKPIRWWPAYVIPVLIFVALLIVWIPNRPDRATQVVSTTIILLVGFILSFFWFFLFSRFNRQIRFRGFGALVLLIVLFVSLFEISGFSGNLAPNVVWRWSSRSVVSNTAPTALRMLTDYSQFLGPDRNATLRGIALESDWVQHPPKLLWRKPVGEAWSAFAVVGRAAVTQEQKGEDETVVCYDLLTGEEKWRHQDKARFQHPMAGIGPRATPTVSGNRVYAFGATGILNCLDLETGENIWSRDTVTEIGAEIQEWGMTSSPLILDDKVIVSLGGREDRSLMAYNKDTGAVVWGGGKKGAGNSSPSTATIAEVDQVLIFNRGQVASHDPITGKLLWQHPWVGGMTTQHVVQPVPLSGDRVFVSTGYGIGSELLQIARDDQGTFTVDVIWKSTRLKAKFANVVHQDGYMYGLDDGILVCLDIQNGQRKWKRGRYGHGQLILVNDFLLILAESGDLVLVEANPNAFVERTAISALNGRTWNSPAFAAPYLLVRNDKEAACYELSLKNVN